MKRWLFDVGNTRLKCAPLGDNGRIGQVAALAHCGHGQLAELALLLPQRGDCAYVCSVASPRQSLAVIELLARRFKCISVARATPGLAGIRNGYPRPARLGVDRFLAMIAARDLGIGPWLVCGVGTAITVDLLDSEGVHRGGRIGPSPEVMRAGLHHAAAHLPPEGGQASAFALDTEDALASGCEGAAVGLVQDSIAAAASMLGATPGLLVHGGGAQALAARFAQAQHEPSLVLQGLARWAAAGKPDGPSSL
jgi:type III pantothenate kinase